MHTEARMGVAVVEGGVGVGGGSFAVDGGSRNYSPRPQLLRQQGAQHQPQIGTLPHLLAGGVAGAFSKTCTAPLARLTILFQVQGMHSDVATLRKASMWREASRIVYEEGFRAFWKGNLVTIAHRLPYSAISFYSYERYKNLLQLIPGLDLNKNNVSADICVRMVGGGLAGITAASITYPLDLVRTRLAAQVVASQLFLITCFIFMALQDDWWQIWRSGTKKRDIDAILKIVLIFESIRARQVFIGSSSSQSCETNYMYYRGISHAVYAICRDEGVRGLYKGLGATLLGVGPNIAISYSVYETLRSQWQLQRPCDSPVVVSLACGSLSGITSSTVTFPLDLVRRRIQLEGAGGRARVYKSGLLGTFGHIVRSEGVRGLYRGILPEYFKVVPSVSIVFMTYEMLKSYLADR